MNHASVHASASATASPAAISRAISAPGVSPETAAAAGAEARVGEAGRDRARGASGAGGSRTVFFFSTSGTPGPGVPAETGAIGPRPPGRRLRAAAELQRLWAAGERVAEAGRVLLDVGRDLAPGVVELLGPVAVVEPAVRPVVAEDLLEVARGGAGRRRERHEHEQRRE